ncbi:hypothetical protein CHELA20_52076 [Hyphomicrobiales bacterium]|nr:hypothetical protein CHELA20_52076 [Hyphomicrobiales bacterium]
MLVFVLTGAGRGLRVVLAGRAGRALRSAALRMTLGGMHILLHVLLAVLTRVVSTLVRHDHLLMTVCLTGYAGETSTIHVVPSSTAGAIKNGWMGSLFRVFMVSKKSNRSRHSICRKYVLMLIFNRPDWAEVNAKIALVATCKDQVRY